ncbi:hypothetical protein LJB88_04655 [Erysipelotrichaceae bacterium OttesenSCG-928-M19]|nr:hypothetical protein [Erysipelotrichaceae bacterium OttesenSCG-928-M19]
MSSLVRKIVLVFFISLLFTFNVKAIEIKVNNYAEFKVALENSAVDTIVLEDDIVVEDELPTLKRSLIIEGNKHIIDFKSNNWLLGNVNTPSKLKINDLEIMATASTLLSSSSANSEQWTVEVGNVKSAAKTTASFLDFSTSARGTFSASGDFSWTNESSSANGFVIRTKHFIASNGAQINLEAKTVALRIETYGTGNTQNISITDGATVSINNVGNRIGSNSAALFINEVASENNKPIVEISGSGSKLYAYSNGADTGEYGGTIVLQGREGELNISAGGQVEVYSTSQSCIIMQNLNGVFNIDGLNSKLKLTQDDDNDYERGATLRFRLQSGQTLNVSNNAKLEITKKAGSAAGIRFYSANNKILVSSGAQVKVENYGTSTNLNPGANGRNQGIHYDGQNSTFEITGKKSMVEIIAHHGAAVDMESYNGIITLGKDSIFIAHGATATATQGAFNAARLSFNAEEPLYYDFSNNRPGGGYIFNVTASSSSVINAFTSTQSDLAVWKAGMDLNDDPYKMWSIFDYSLAGNNYQNIVSTNIPEEFNTTSDSYGNSGVMPYSRMSGNNAKPIVDELIVPEDADRYLHGHVSIPEGLSINDRDAWHDEVYVQVKETKVDGSINYYIGSTKEEYSVYGATQRDGIFVVDLGKLATKGDQYEVVKAWRGSADINSERNHYSSAADIKTSRVVVQDVTPPIPVTSIANVDQSSKIISGQASEIGAQVKIKINGIAITDLIGEVANDNSWLVTLPDNIKLQVNDVITVILVDDKGNENPLEQTSYHDAIFAAATQTIVVEANPNVEGKKEVNNLSSDDNQYRVNDLLEYHLTFTIKDGSAYNIVISDSLPNGLLIKDYEQTINGIIDNENISLSDGILISNISKAQPGTTINITIKAEITKSALGKTIENSANIKGYNKDNELCFNQTYHDNNTLLVKDSEPLVSITKMVSNDSNIFKVGSSVNYKIVLKVEQGVLKNSLFKDELDSHLSIKGLTVDKQKRDAMDNEIILDLGTMAVNQEIVIEIEAEILESGRGKTISNQSYLSGTSDAGVNLLESSNLVFINVMDLSAQQIIDDANKNNLAEPTENLQYTIKLKNKAESATMVYYKENLSDFDSVIAQKSKVNIYSSLSKQTTIVDFTTLSDGILYDMANNEELTIVFNITLNNFDVMTKAKLVSLFNYNDENIATSLLSGEYKTISGLVFEDINYNGFNDEKSFLEAINVYLLDDEGTIVAETLSDSHGKYRFTRLLQAKQNYEYYIMVEELPEYLLANKASVQTIYSSSINHDTKKSDKISLQSTDLTNYNVGYAKDVMISVLPKEKEISVGQQRRININYKYANIDKIIVDNNNVEAKLVKNVLTIKANDSGTAKVSIIIQDQYQRNSLTREINVETTLDQEDYVKKLEKQSTGTKDESTINTYVIVSKLPNTGQDISNSILLLIIATSAAFTNYQIKRKK